MHYVQGDTDQVFFGEGTGGSRSATLGGSRRATSRPRRSSPRRRQIAAHLLKVDVDDINFEDGMFSQPEDQPHPHHQGGREGGGRPGEPAEGHGGRPDRHRDLHVARSQNFPNGCHVCELEIDAETGEVEIVRYSVVDDVGTVINPLLLKGQIVGGVAQGVGQILMEDIHFDRRRPAR